MAARSSVSRATALRETVRATALQRYETLSPDDRLGIAVADRTLTTGWQRADHPVLELEPPIDWDAGGDERSWAFHLHAWDGLGPVLAAYDAMREPRYLEFALRAILDWAGEHPAIGDDGFSWYDMATGLRAYRLAYAIDAAARMDGVGDDTLERLLDALALHVTALADDTRFAAHTNHGFFQAAGQLAMARRLPGLPGMDAASAQGAARLRALVDQQFAADGMHREHSPGYHDAVLSALGAILDAGLLDDPELHAIRRRSEDALAWLVLPDGTLAPFGDTDAEDRPAAAGEDAHPHLRFMLSGGREGEAPGDLVRGFQSGGYAVCRRLPPGDPAGGSYLAQICAFHSRTHKHADHLAVIWHERGHDLLVEAGRYDYLGRLDPRSSLGRQGFWYSDPRRVYVESTRAHNTVEIDRRPHARRSVAPFGSALARHGEEAGIAYVESQVRHRRSVVQTRLLLFDPGRWLIVLDNLSDTSGQTHRYVQRFLFGPELDLAPLGQGFALRIPGEAQRLYVAPLLPSAPVAAARGQEQPELAGWVSRRARAITPAWTAGFEVEGTARHTFATLLALGDAKPIPDPERCRANVTGRRARLAWRIGDEDVQVDVDRESEEVGIRVRRRAWPPPDPAVTE